MILVLAYWIVLSHEQEQCKLCCKDNSARHDRNRMKLHIKCSIKIQNLVERQVVCLKFNANIPRETFPSVLISFDIDISWQCEVNTEPISNQKTCDINVNTTTLEGIKRNIHPTGKSFNFTVTHSFIFADIRLGCWWVQCSLHTVTIHNISQISKSHIETYVTLRLIVRLKLCVKC